MKEWLFPSQCARCGESEADTEWNVDQVKEESVYQTYSINVPVCEDCRSVSDGVQSYLRDCNQPQDP